MLCVTGSRLPNLHITTESHQERPIGLRTHDLIKKQLHRLFFERDGLVNGVTHIQQQADLQRQIVGTRKLAKALNCEIVVKNADVIRRQIGDQPPVLVSDSELEPHLGCRPTDGVSRSS